MFPFQTFLFEFKEQGSEASNMGSGLFCQTAHYRSWLSVLGSWYQVCFCQEPRAKSQSREPEPRAKSRAKSLPYSVGA